MSNTFPKVIKCGDWLFEIKLVAGTKISESGEGLAAVANLTVVGDNVYIDSQLASSTDSLSKQDYLMIYEFCRKIGASSLTYDRIKNGQRRSSKVKIKKIKTSTPNGASSQNVVSLEKPKIESDDK